MLESNEKNHNPGSRKAISGRIELNTSLNTRRGNFFKKRQELPLGGELLPRHARDISHSATLFPCSSVLLGLSFSPASIHDPDSSYSSTEPFEFHGCHELLIDLNSSEWSAGRLQDDIQRSLSRNFRNNHQWLNSRMPKLTRLTMIPSGSLGMGDFCIRTMVGFNPWW